MLKYVVDPLPQGAASGLTHNIWKYFYPLLSGLELNCWLGGEVFYSWDPIPVVDQALLYTFSIVLASAMNIKWSCGKTWGCCYCWHWWWCWRAIVWLEFFYFIKIEWKLALIPWTKSRKLGHDLYKGDSLIIISAQKKQVTFLKWGLLASLFIHVFNR